ncbi:MAG: Signal transduction histidine kinase [Candidatus Solibacter sp.]|jgi:two-component system NtrC family sensor kinase|nr:Signal transduction histidine kinase [Candidatus Solibacter sp.]
MERACRVMVVEDSATQAFKMRLLLEGEGYEVSTVATAESALAELSQSPPDLILVEYYLSGMLGDELCRRIRMNPSTRRIPILMVTAVGAGAAGAYGPDCVADDFISNSESADVLILRIRAMLRKALAQSAISDPEPPHFNRALILAIDDSPTHLALIDTGLRSHGYEVETAASGPEGLDKLASRSFDCVLVDLIMPGMDGIEVCRRISGMRYTLQRSAAVIMLTSSDTNEDMTRGLEAGADDFVCKSGDLTILRVRIRALLRRRLFEDENRRIVEELKTKEMETLRANAGREAAEARAAMADALVHANRNLQEANRRLKETQAQLVQTEKMASLGQLVAGLAHEINNPLAFVVNNLYTVETGLDRIAPEAEPHLSEPSLAKMRKVRTRLREMGEGLDRIKELVVNLRTFSRLDEGEFKTIDIGDSIDSVLVLLNHKMNGRIQVDRHYGPGRSLSCYAGRLNQVFMNLIANAVDAIPRNGKIVITTSQSDDEYCISVRDNGKGIPEAIRGRIFDPFFTDKPIGQGTGLGLAISYGIVQDHHGSIEVHSQEGAGSEFSVRIPRDLESRRHE